MIKSIEGADWENYRYFQLDLSPGVNIVLGKSHYGKSSVVRAINWVLQNRPRGTNYFPHGNKKPNTEVVLDFYDGVTITRERSKSVNQYSVSSVDKPFEALNTGVPEQIKTSSNMAEINIQIQKDVHYFLSDAWSPGKRAKTLNEIVNLEEMDIATEIINSTIAELDKTYKTESKRLETLEKEKEELYWSIEARKEVQVILDFDDKIAKKEKRFNAIETIVKEIELLEEEKKKLPDMSAIGFIDAIMEFNAQLYLKEKREATINKLAEELRDLKNKEKGISLPDPLEISKLEAFSAILKGKKQVTLYLSELISLKDMQLKAQKIVDGENKKFHESLKELGICPLCGCKV